MKLADHLSGEFLECNFFPGLTAIALGVGLVTGTAQNPADGIHLTPETDSSGQHFATYAEKYFSNVATNKLGEVRCEIRVIQVEVLFYLENNEKGPSTRSRLTAPSVKDQ
jgi:hypothetical protein